MIDIELLLGSCAGSAGVARKPAGPSKLATAPKPKLGAAKLTAKGGNADFDWGSFLDE